MKADEHEAFNWVVYSAEASAWEGEPMYWSNEFGWVDLESATRFTEDETKRLNLPTGGEWKKL